MERLTEKRDGQNVIPLRQDRKVKWALCNAGKGDSSTQYLYGEHVHKLADYENTGYPPEQVVEMAKELAELKKQLPPCKVGDTVYWINNHYRTYADYKVDKEEVELLIFDGEDWIVDMGGPKDGIFGKTVFLTQAEAEAKLKEMEGK